MKHYRNGTIAPGLIYLDGDAQGRRVFGEIRLLEVHLVVVVKGIVKVGSSLLTFWMWGEHVPTTVFFVVGLSQGQRFSDDTLRSVIKVTIGPPIVIKQDFDLLFLACNGWGKMRNLWP